MKKRFFLGAIAAVFFLTSICHAERFVNNGDETVTDTRTGLMWEKKTNDGGDRDKDNTYLWEQALDYCEKLTLSGHTDWRLPTIKELTGIVDLTRFNPAIDIVLFPNTISSLYWSSSIVEYSPWGVSFDRGENYLMATSEIALNVRAVRGGQPLISDNLYITTPRQASNWDIGSIMPIAWDTAGIGGNVTISLSRDGGKPGTYVDLTTTDNDGYYEWTVTGPATYNGYIKIAPLNDPAKTTSNGLFSIQDYILIENKTPENLIIKETPGSNTATFIIRLTQAPVADTEVRINLYSSHTNQCTVSPAAVTLDQENWPGGAIVTVTGVDDDQLDGDYACTIRTDPVESTDPDYRGMTVPDIEVRVQDDDRASTRIDSMLPNKLEVQNSFSPTVYGQELTDITRAFLVLEDPNGNPIWDHTVEATQITPLGGQMGAVFPVMNQIGQYTLYITQDIDGTTKDFDLKGAVTVFDPITMAELERKKAIIVAGQKDPNDGLWSSTRNCANRAYRTLRFQGFSGLNIHYLTHMTNMDVDGDDELDRDGIPFRTALKDAIIGSFTAEADELILYMVDHGADRIFHLADRNTVTASDLRGWLDDLQRNRPVRVIVIIDACMSGTFLEGLKPEGIHEQSERIVIASAGPDKQAWFENEGDESFSRHFWDAAYSTGRLYRSFINGKEHMSIQNPLADRTEDGNEDSITLAALGDGTLTDIRIGRGRYAGSTPPEIGYVCFGSECNSKISEQSIRNIACSTSTAVSASGLFIPNGTLRVFAQILSPKYENAPPNEPVMDVPTIDLEETNRHGTYTATYDDFTATGNYRILVFATDKKNATSTPKMVRAVRTCGIAPKKGDINIDLETDLIDAIIALKVLAGMDVADQIRADYVSSGVDVDGLNQVDMAEAVYGLQKAAEVRE